MLLSELKLVESEMTLKLKMPSGGNKEGVERFLADFKAETFANPFSPRMRVYKDSIGVELYASEGMIHLSSIISFAKKNAGQASVGLAWLCSLADKHQVVMDLTVSPFKNAGTKDGKDLNKAQLKAWYKRNGFVPKGGDLMIRQPKVGA